MDRDKDNIYNSESELNSGAILDDFGFDERQKIENYEIGFRLFRILIIVAMIFSYIVNIWCSMAENLIGTVLSIVMFAVFYGFYVIYAYLTAKKGVMNPKFARNLNKKYSYVGLAAVFCAAVIFLVLEIRSGERLYDIVRWILLLILIAESWLINLCARKNNRILAEQFKEDD